MPEIVATAHAAEIPIPQLSPDLLPSALLAVAVMALIKLVELWFSRRGERGKTEDALLASLPSREREFREQLVRERTYLLDQLLDVRENEENCREQLRRTEHRLANAQVAIYALERKLDLPLTDFDKGFPEESSDRAKLTKRERLRAIRDETGSDRIEERAKRRK